MKRKYLSMAVGCALLAPAAFVQAQEQQHPAGHQQATQLDEVTVTARRRTESIQDVPVAVSAFGEEQIKDLQASTVEGLQGAVPNMNIAQGRGSANSVNVFIRGIGQPDALQTFDPGVGMYVDDVYYSRINGALFSLFDIQQLEVLRGPQGTLYGKNSTGGAIKLTTKNPFDNEGGAVEVTAGDYGRLEGRFYVSGKLSDTFAASAAGAKITNDGYVRDADTGKHYNDDDTEALRVKLAFNPADNFRATLSLDTTKQDAALTLGRPMANLERTDVVLGKVVLKPGETGKWDRRVRTSFKDGQGQYLKHSGASLAMDWDIDEQWTLKSISAYRKLKTKSYIDIDASEYELGDVLVALDQNQKSQEFQLHYDNGSNLHLTFGAYYMKENVPSYQEAYASDLFGVLGSQVKFLRTISDDLETTSKAAFAHANWTFAPSWTLAAGVRWTKDTKDYERTTSTFWGAPFTGLNETVPFPATSASWTAMTPSVSLQKAFSDNLMGYVSANRGFKSGGFNGRANSAYEVRTARFNPEFVWTYEAGLKGTSADRRFRGSAAAFYSNYSDFQARVSEISNPGSMIPDFKFPVLNAAKVNIKGIELEGSALLGEATTLSGQLSWLDAKYDRFDDPRHDPAYPGYDPVNVIHDHVPFSPDWTARVALQHVFGLGDNGNLTFGGDVSYRGKTWLSVDNRAVLSQDAYTLVGVYGVWDSPQMAWQVRAGVRNLTDRQYKTEGQEFASIANIQTAYYGLPRNWYVSLRYNF
ncbi:TonB-dependent receptor [Stenotrophomonas sp. PS02297]|uniref:TonB-dependent receptor n=1 Tax=Stenotrophomonas sp. PS02297 TaxID=2991423 RepID=UPI00249CEC21|nr:TonB-dependent receptor [Stenotrophomonas sp. PS02297]